MSTIDSQFEVEVAEGVHALDYNQQIWTRHGYAVVDGCEPSEAGSLDVGVSSGSVYHGGELVEVAEQTVTLTAGQTEPRKDTLLLGGDGVLFVEQGEPARALPRATDRFDTYQPTPPLPDEPAVVVGEVWVPAGAGEVGPADVRDRRDRSTSRHHAVRADEFDITPLAEGTIIAETGETPAAFETVENVTDEEARPVELLLAPDGSPAFAGDYGFNYKYTRLWDDANGHLNVTIQVNWDTDPGENLDLAYQILPRY